MLRAPRRRPLRRNGDIFESAAIVMAIMCDAPARNSAAELEHGEAASRNKTEMLEAVA